MPFRKTPYDGPPTNGQQDPNASKQPDVQEAYISALDVASSPAMRIYNSTMSSPLSEPVEKPRVSESMPDDYSVRQQALRSSAQLATQLKLSEKMSKGVKHDLDKPSLAYIPLAALYEEGKAFSYGANKYEAWNYKNGIAITRTLSATLRHIAQFLSGENVDSESGVNHLGCARANLAMALDTLANHPEYDDRFKGNK